MKSGATYRHDSDTDQPLTQKPNLREKDPGELYNLAGERPADLERMRQLAEAQRRADADFLSSLQSGKREPRLDPTLVEQLRRLGYAR